jgi:DNA repair protein REV1
LYFIVFFSTMSSEKTNSSASLFEVPTGFGDYMRQKTKKLQAQYNEAITKRSDLMSGIVVYVDGFTEPSSNELKHMIVSNGGVYTLYLNSRVTHVVCEHLPHAKLAQLSNNDRIVRPAWIVDSIHHQRLLPIDDYVVASARRPSMQRTLPLSSAPTRAAAAVVVPPPVHTSTSIADTHLELNGRPSAADNPRAFVRHFYEQSRLHHLSTWKAQLQQDLQDYVSQRAGVTLAHADASTARTRSSETFLYVDMDCFFAAVSLAKRPHLAGQPVVVCHASPNSTGHSDIASASYEARRFGIRNGMWMHEAKKLCPTLVSVPYDFEEYEVASRALYECILKHSSRVEVRSCDEAVCAVSCATDDALRIARAMRSDIFAATNCGASVGVGASILTAKLACRFAKPNTDGSEGRGAYAIPLHELSTVLGAMPIRSLPGVGYRTAKRLIELHTGVPAAATSSKPSIFRKPDAEVGDESESDDDESESSGEKNAPPKMTVADIVAMPLNKLQATLGAQIGQQLYNTSRGIDTRELRCHIERKTLGAEINFGIRFTTMDHVTNFVRELALELERRARAADYRGRLLTLKLKQREPDAGEAVKFLGHGHAFNLSKSHRLAEATCDPETITVAAMALYRALGCPPDQLRGIGIHLSVLERGASVAARQRSIRSALRSNTTTTTTTATTTADLPTLPPTPIIATLPPPIVQTPHVSLPPMSQIDPQVWESLPASLQREIESAYGEVAAVKIESTIEKPVATTTKRKESIAANVTTAAAATTTTTTTTAKKRRTAAAPPANENAVNVGDEVLALVGPRVFAMLDDLLRRQLAADVKAGNERRRADKDASLWYADSYLREIDFAVLECLSATMVCETLREQRRQAALSVKEIVQQQRVAAAAAATTAKATTKVTRDIDNAGAAADDDENDDDLEVDHAAGLFSSIDDVRVVVRGWLEARAPNAEVRAQLTAEAARLISAKQLDSAHIVLYELRRRAIVAASEWQRGWEECFDTVLTSSQNALHEAYGGVFAFAPLQR